MTTGFVVDSRFQTHTLPGHPEHAGRLTAVQGQLEAVGLLERCVAVPTVPASNEALLAVHTPRYLAKLEETTQSHGMTMLGLDTYVLPQSYEIARLAAGATVNVVEAVMRGDIHNGFVLVRPPGHHATPSEGMGFCLLNNVAIAARALQEPLERVLIVDYDVHHGNGTQDVFYSDPGVFYVSTHQSPLYPGTGALQETGAGAGKGYTLNVPLPPGTGDDGFRRVFDEIVQPAVWRFEPQFILVSTGFDAHWADPLANLQVTLSEFDRMTRDLIGLADELCEGRIVFVMEGGYDLAALRYGWANVVRALLGESESVDPLGAGGASSERAISALIERIKDVHQLT